MTTMTTMTTMTRWTLLLTLAWCLAGAGPAALAQDAGKPQARPDSEQRFEQRFERTRNMLWWNKATKVEEFSLSNEQRAAMDALVRELMEKRRGDTPKQRETFSSFGETLGAGDAAATREAGERVIETVALPMRRQIELMIEVVGMLTVEQREMLATKYPNILSRPWVRFSSKRMGVGPSRARQGGKEE